MIVGPAVVTAVRLAVATIADPAGARAMTVAAGAMTAAADAMTAGNHVAARVGRANGASMAWGPYARSCRDDRSR